MAKFKLTPLDYITIDREGETLTLIKKKSFEDFNESTLGLGDLSVESHPTNAIAAIFDLAGFTAFCNQSDPHLVIPDFMRSFLEWIYAKIREESIFKKHPEGYVVWSDFPFYSKFLGDGILFLWDTKDMNLKEIGNVILALKEICRSYVTEFYVNLSENYSYPPNALRCGIARGVVYNVGDGNDYVGPCINVASRLQKIGGLSFCFSKRGIDMKKCLEEEWHGDLIIKRTNIRGIGSEELICCFKEEFDSLSKENKQLFF